MDAFESRRAREARVATQTGLGPKSPNFVANRVGPVRAIRSWVGANSGPSTQRTVIAYPGREDIVSDLRVHQIPSVMDLWDYSDAAIGK